MATDTQNYRFPKDPILVKLLQTAKQIPEQQVTIKDLFGFEKTYPELLSDTLKTRDQIKSLLPTSAFNEKGLLRDEAVYVAAITRTGYQFAVAFFAIRSLGGAFLPIDPQAALERQSSSISKAKASCILFDNGCIKEAKKLCEYVEKTEEEKRLAALPISCNSPPLAGNDIIIDEDLPLDPNGPGFVCMTSGTTGYSKGVVIRRVCLTSAPVEKQASAVVNYNESHWLGGTKNIIDGIVTGKKVFALECPATSEDVLNIFLNHRITHFVFNPALLRGMKQLLLGEREFTEEERQRISPHFSGLSFFLCIGGLVEQPTVDFWEAVLGYPQQNRYGSTELAGLPTLGLTKMKGSVGKLAPGIEMKLSEGTHGRLYLKSPDRFLCYLGDEAATRAAFDDEGFYKTGDIAELKDGELIFHGRERDDYIVFGESRTSALKVERCLMELPYVTEACVVAVPVREGQQLCGAVIRLKDDSTRGKEAKLDQIRSDLQAQLDSTMLPTVLRLLKPHEELPRTATGKPIKRQVIEDLFYAGDCGRDWFAIDNPPPGVECCGMPISVA